MNRIYQLIYKDGSVSEPYTDIDSAMNDAIEFSTTNEDGCALYSLATGLSTMFFNGDMATTWIDYEKVQQWFGGDDEPPYTDRDTAIQLIDKCFPERNCIITDDNLDNFLDIYLFPEQVNQIYKMADNMQDYVSCVELNETEIIIRFSNGTFIGFIID